MPGPASRRGRRPGSECRQRLPDTCIRPRSSRRPGCRRARRLPRPGRVSGSPETTTRGRSGPWTGLPPGLRNRWEAGEPVGPDPVLAQAARTATRVRLKTRRMMSPWLDSIERRGCTIGSSQGGCCAVRATAVGCARVRNVHRLLTNRPLPPRPVELFWKTTASSDPRRPEPTGEPHQLEASPP